MNKLFNRFFWHNNTAPALNESNLDIVCKAIDEIDNRVVMLGGYAADAQTAIQTAQQLNQSSSNYAQISSAKATEAGTQVTKAKAEVDKAKVEADRAKVEADRAMSGTPEGYADLVDLVGTKISYDSITESAETGYTADRDTLLIVEDGDKVGIDFYDKVKNKVFSSWEYFKSKLGMAVVNPNLLDNGWFEVNTRGQSSYTNTSAVDRWKILNATLTVNSDGSINVPKGSNVYLYQVLDTDLVTRLIGNTCTFSLMMQDGTIYTKTFDSIVKGGNTYTFDFGTVIPCDNNRQVLIYGFTRAVNIKAIKLELGSVSTLQLDSPAPLGIEQQRCWNSTADANDTYANGYVPQRFEKIAPSSLNNWAHDGQTHIVKDGSVCMLTIHGYTTNNNTSTTLFTIPTNCRPKENCFGVVFNNSNGEAFRATVTPSGTVSLSKVSINTIYMGSVTWVIEK